MKKHFLIKPILAVAMLAALPHALAHRTWLIPSMSHVDGKEPWVTFDAAVSEDLFVFGANAIKLDGLSITAPDGKSVAAENTFTGKLRSSFDLKLSQTGTYRISLVGESVMASYKQGAETKRFRGTLEAFAKEVPADAPELRSTITHGRLETFVTSGRGNDTAFKPVGLGMELVPLTHPETFLPGQPARFRVLLNGQPAPELTVSVVPGGVRYRGVLREQAIKTDAKGEFSVKWPEAGMYALNASYPPRPAGPMGEAGQGGASAASAATAAAPAKRFTYSGTLEVLPE
jgi:uncharacterized GH25 family protein